MPPEPIKKRRVDVLVRSSFSSLFVSSCSKCQARKKAAPAKPKATPKKKKVEIPEVALSSSDSGDEMEIDESASAVVSEPVEPEDDDGDELSGVLISDGELEDLEVVQADEISDSIEEEVEPEVRSHRPFLSLLPLSHVSYSVRRRRANWSPRQKEVLRRLHPRRRAPLSH